MILDDKDKLNLIDALKEWEESSGFKELDEEDVGLNHERYVNLMRRLGVTGDIENNFSWDKYVEKFIWVLDASSAGVLKVEIPSGFPENGDYEALLIDALPKDVRLKDCSWMICDDAVQNIGVER